MKTVRRFIIFFSLSIFISSCSVNDSTPCIDKNCSDFATQAEAQIAYDADRDCHNDLDRENDGIACEHLPKKKKK